MKIIFIVSHLYPSGPNIQLYLLIRSLIIEQEFKPTDIEIVTFKYREYDWIEDELRKMNIKVSSFGSRNKFIISGYWKSLNYLRTFFGVKIISYGIYADVMSLLNSNGCEHYSFVHSTLRTNYQNRYGKLIGILITQLHLQFYRRMSGVLSISQSLLEYLSSEGLKSMLVPNSFVNDRVSSAVHVVKTPSSFLTISSSIKGKNVDALCEFFKDRPDWNLTILGFYDNINKYKEYSNINYKGYRKDIYSELSAAKYFISASTHEGLPNAPIEALFMGCFVILSDIPAHCEIVSMMGSMNCTTFSIVNTGQSLEQLFDGLESFNFSPLSQVRARVLDVFNTSRMSAKFIEAIKF